MSRRGNPWMRLGMDSLRLGAESQGVIALRMMALAVGGPSAAKEAELMVSEKMRAVAETQTQVFTSLLMGQGHLAASRAVTAYRRKVRANLRRLG